MMPVKFADPGHTYRRDREALDGVIGRVLTSGSYILGEECKNFESAFSDYVGVAECIGVASGTDAIELALRACGVKPGDVVLAPSHTAVATIVGIERAGGTPAFVDVDDATYTIDPNRLVDAIPAARKVAGRTAGRLRALVAVHLYGRAADVDGLAEVAEAHGLDLIEDCAQAHGGRWKGRPLGSFGRAAAFSFYPTKNLGAFGDGGLVATSDADLARRVRSLRQYGWHDRYVSSERGLNSRLDEVQAAVLNAKLARLESDNAQRRSVARLYRDALRTYPVSCPEMNEEGVRHVFHQFTIRVADRDGLRSHLASLGVDTGVLYPLPVHLQPAYSGVESVGSLEVTERLCRQILCLPIGPHVGPEEAGRVIAALQRWSWPS